MYVYFEFTVPLKVYSEVLIFVILICVVVIVLHCCQQPGKIFSIVAHSTEKSLALLPSMPLIFPLCGPQRVQMICVVAYTEEKLSVLLANNAEKCSNLNISTNSKPYANLGKISWNCPFKANKMSVPVQAHDYSY
jgi:hypothetical protein